jgi:hypothetical protein
LAVRLSATRYVQQKRFGTMFSPTGDGARGAG